MKKLEELKGLVSEEQYAAIEEILLLCVNVNFDYLEIRLASWENLIVRIIHKMLETGVISIDLTGELFKNINIAVKNYIRKELKNGNIRVCNNLFLKLRKSLRRGLLFRSFVYELEHLGISFLDEVYDLMKENSVFFRNLLKNLGILDYSKRELVNYLNFEYQMGLKLDDSSKRESISYEEISRKYSNMSLEEIKDLYGVDFYILPISSKILLERYFSTNVNPIYSVYNSEKEINLLLSNYRKKSTILDISKLKEAYLNNQEEFNPEQRLYLECYIFMMKEKSEFRNKYPNSTVYRRKSELLNRLERLYFDIDELFLYTLTKDQYLKVLELYPDEVDGKKKELLDLYYGINGKAKTIAEISEIYNVTPEEMRNTIWGIRKKLLSLYNNMDDKINIDKNTYIPYILDRKFELNDEAREALKLLLVDNLTYEEIAKVLNEKDNGKKEKQKTSKDIAILVSRGLQKIDTYRFGIDKPINITKRDLDEFFNTKNKDKTFEKVIRLKYEEFLNNDEIAELLGIEKSKVNRIASDFKNDFTNLKIRDIELSIKEIEDEINRHFTDSVLNDVEKSIISYYLGIKSRFNPRGEKLSSKEINKKLDITGDITHKSKDILDKIKRRKINDLTPELIYIDRDRLVEILENSHLPITLEDREIICYLLELNGYPLKTCKELAEIFSINEKGIKRKYQMAIININKYLLGEKEGILSYELDIVPNLKYFTLAERKLIVHYYGGNFSYNDLAKKYDISIDKVKRIMYRIKSQINSLVKDNNTRMFDFDYYEQVVDEPNLPFYGNRKLAKTIFELYVGYNSFDRLSLEEIKEKLDLNISVDTILNIVNGFILSIFKYKIKIKKENTFSLDDVREYYLKNKENLEPQELELFVSFFKKNVGIDCKMNDNLTFLLLKAKNPNYFRISGITKEKAMELLRKYSKQLTKKTRDSLMVISGLSERDLMSGQEKNRVFRLLANLDRNLAKKEAQKRVLNPSC